MVEWVTLWPIFDVCEKDMGYEGGGELQMQWRRQVSEDNQLKSTVEEILVATRVRRRQESGRSGERKRGLEGESIDSKG